MPVPAPPDCGTELKRLYDAIMALQGGAQVTSISFGERAVQYGQPQLPALIGLYRQFWMACGKDAGWPDLSPSAAVERSGPARYSMF